MKILQQPWPNDKPQTNAKNSCVCRYGCATPLPVPRWPLFCALLILVLAASARAQQAPETGDRSPFTVRGRVCYGSSYLLRNIPVYLFTWEQSSKAREAMRSVERRLHSPNNDIMQETKATVDFLNEVDRLVGKLPSSGKVKTDRSGHYQFSGVAPGSRYLVVTEWAGEDGVDFSARPTAILTPGQKLSLDLTITTTPWEMEVGDCSKATVH